MLSEGHRKRLDSIVAQMVANGETDGDIQFVVDDYRSQHENEKTFRDDPRLMNFKGPSSDPLKAFEENKANFYKALPGATYEAVVKGPAKAVASMVTSGVRDVQALAGGYTPGTQAYEQQANRPANVPGLGTVKPIMGQSNWELLDTGLNALSLLPAGKAAPKVVSGAVKATKAVTKGAAKATGSLASGVGRLAVGDDAASALSATAKSPTLVNAFRTGKRTFQNVAEDLDSALTAMSSQGRKRLDNVIEAMPGRPVDVDAIATKFDDILATHGQSLSQAEEHLLGKFQQAIQKWDDWTDKGVVRLRQLIDRSGFYKRTPEYKQSDKIISDTRRLFNDVASEGNDLYRPALNQAVGEIELADSLRFLDGASGSNPEISARRLQQLAAKLDDPITNAATKDALELLQKNTGIDIISQLEAAQAAKVTNKNPGILNSPLKSAQAVSIKVLQRVTEKASQVLKALESKPSSSVPKIKVPTSKMNAMVGGMSGASAGVSQDSNGKSSFDAKLAAAGFIAGTVGGLKVSELRKAFDRANVAKVALLNKGLSEGHPSVKALIKAMQSIESQIFKIQRQ